MKLINLSSVLLLTIVFLSTTKSQNILEKFLLEKLAGYDRWILANDLDPSPMIVGPTHIHGSHIIAPVDCYLSNHLVKDHSRTVNVTSVKADLESISVSFALQDDITFSGNYIGNGSLMFGKNFSAEGRWHIIFPEIKFQNMYFNYSISNTGYISIDNYNLDGISVPASYSRDAEVYFEDLWTAEDVASSAESIQDSVYGAFTEYLKKNQEYPLKKMYLNFFEEVFANNTWADIIVPELPDPEIPEATSDPTEEPTTSSTIPSSTTPPPGNMANYLTFSKLVATAAILTLLVL